MHGKERILEEVKKTLLMGGKDFSEEMSLSKACSQTEAILEVLMKNNIFLAGPAGSGKTATIKAIQDIFFDLYGDSVKIATTATTGIASTLLPNGKTLHSWSGMRIGDEPFVPSVGSFIGGKMHIHRIRTTDILIIDEVSMLSADTFIKLDAMLKYAKGNDRPFGGIQLIMSGDFMQLPPVITTSPYSGKEFCFETDLWKELNIKYCFLDRIYRSKCKKLSYVLHNIAKGETPDTDETLRKLLASRYKREPGGIYSTLFTTNRDVDRFNKEKQDANSGESRTYLMVTGKGNKKEIEDLVANSKIEREICLKVGDIVMVTQNFRDEDEEFIPNGLIGKVVALKPREVKIQDKSGRTISVGIVQYTKENRQWIRTEKVVNKVPVVDYILKEDVIASVSQIPLRLAYAITVHKSQGQTFDGVACDLSTCFTTGLGYVALSRAQNLDSITIQGLSKRSFSINEKCFNMMEKVRKSSRTYIKSKTLENLLILEALEENLKRVRKRKLFRWEGNLFFEDSGEDFSKKGSLKGKSKAKNKKSYKERLQVEEKKAKKKSKKKSKK